jgi:hypothetical protein
MAYEKPSITVLGMIPEPLRRQHIMATKKSRTTDKVPAGFREIDNSLSGFWKPTDVGQTLQGVVGQRITTKGAEGKANTFYAIRLVSPTVAVQNDKGEDVETEAGDLIGVGGALLLAFLAANEGREVYLIYKGLGTKKTGKNPPKMYGTFVKEYDGETGEIPF